MGPTVGDLRCQDRLKSLQTRAAPQIPVEAITHREKRSLAIFDLVSRALTHWILPEGLIKNTDELANQTSPAFTPLSIQLILASRNVVSTKEAFWHKRDTEVPTALEKEIIENRAHIMASTATSDEATWHPADIWLVAFMIVNVLIGLLGLAYKHQTIIDILSKKSLTKGRDMKQDFSRVTHL